MSLPPIEEGDVCVRNVATGENWVPLADAAHIQADAANSRRCLLCRLRRWFAARRPAPEPWDSSFPGPIDGGEVPK